MNSLGSTRVPLCEGMTRREWLRIGALPLAGLTMPALLRSRAQAKRERRKRTRSCIVLFLFGGPARQAVWDRNPEALVDYRGEFKPIASTVPGISVSEHIPRLAQQAKRFALVRSVTHPDNTHTIAMHYMLTGMRHRQPKT